MSARPELPVVSFNSPPDTTSIGPVPLLEMPGTVAMVGKSPVLSVVDATPARKEFIRGVTKLGNERSHAAPLAARFFQVAMDAERSQRPSPAFSMPS